MTRIGNIIVGLLAALHGYILVLEMFLWESPRSLRMFGLSPEVAKETLALGANQGLYNGFLAAGLLWGLFLGAQGRPVKTFFLICIAIAGVFGAVTVNPRIVFIQTVPAVIALGLLWMGKPSSPPN